MNPESCAELGWKPVVLELLRRLAGAPSQMSLDDMRAAVARHDRTLIREGIDWLYFALCEPEHPRQRLYRALWQAQLSATRCAIDELRRRGGDAIVFKGLEVGARYLPTHGLYMSADVDLLVAGRDLWRAEQTLYAQGYERLRYNLEEHVWQERDPHEGIGFAAAGYELAPFVQRIRVDDAHGACLAATPAIREHLASMFELRDDGPYVTVAFDVHHNVMFRFNVTPLLHRAVPSALGTGRALCPADHLWFLLHRYYFEVAIGSISELRVLAPIAAMLNDPAIDWPLLVRNAVECRATAPCLYWLTFFHRLGAPGVPTDVLSELRAHHADSERDFGWQLGRLFHTIEAFPEHLLH